MTAGVPDEAPAPAYPIASVDKALRLALLFRDRQVVRLSEASEELGLGRSTTHRLLAMLQYHGFVRREPDTRAYVAGPSLLDLGLAAVRDLDAAAVRPALDALTAELKETTHLCVLRGPSIVFVDSVESPRTLRTGSRIGVSLPAHCTSGGKAILARMPVEALALIYPEERLVGLTPASVTSLSALVEELALVRERGWATNVGESESDIAAIGVALDGPGPRAAIAVSAPRERLTGERLERAARAALRMAERVRRRRGD